MPTADPTDPTDLTDLTDLTDPTTKLARIYDHHLRRMSCRGSGNPAPVWHPGVPSGMSRMFSGQHSRTGPHAGTPAASPAEDVEPAEAAAASNPQDMQRLRQYAASDILPDAAPAREASRSAQSLPPV